MANTEVLKESFKKGDRVYKQVRRNDLVAMYKVEEKGHIYYEVFKIRLTKGRKVALKSGLVDVKMGEEYPSTKSFGFMNYCCHNLQSANDRFHQISKKVGINT